MRYFLAWLFPPAAHLACGKPVQALLSLLLCLTLVGIPFAVFWGILTVKNAQHESRHRRLVRELRRPRA